MSPQIMPSDAELRSNRAEEALAIEEDARLRNDIRLLGRILGDTVRDQEGDDVFDLVERIRQTSIRFHRDDDRPARRELETILDSMSTQRDRADRARVQLFLSSGQHRRRPEPHPPDAGALGCRRTAASGNAAVDAVSCAFGGFQHRRSAQVFLKRPRQPRAHRAPDGGAAQKHDRSGNGNRGAAWTERERMQQTPDELAAGDEELRREVLTLWQTNLLRAYQAHRDRRGRRTASRSMTTPSCASCRGFYCALEDQLDAIPTTAGGKSSRRSCGWEAGSAATATAIRSSRPR